MQIHETSLPDVLVFEPKVFRDERGFFFESYNRRIFQEATGFSEEFAQDNHSRSDLHVLRGLHYQLPPAPQAKLVRVVAGAIYDVAVDIRRASPSFGQWFGVELTSENMRQLWVPAGFAHGFIALAEGSEVLYKASGFYSPQAERSIRWDDPTIGVEWPIDGEPRVSEKDAQAPHLGEADVFD